MIDEYHNAIETSLGRRDMTGRVLLDNIFTFGGTHYLNPRELFVHMR
jgi:hypothetical protein